MIKATGRHSRCWTVADASQSLTAAAAPCCRWCRRPQEVRAVHAGHAAAGVQGQPGLSLGTPAGHVQHRQGGQRWAHCRLHAACCWRCHRDDRPSASSALCALHSSAGCSLCNMLHPVTHQPRTCQPVTHQPRTCQPVTHQPRTCQPGLPATPSHLLTPSPASPSHRTC
jgi:hypothetical protein